MQKIITSLLALLFLTIVSFSARANDSVIELVPSFDGQLLERSLSFWEDASTKAKLADAIHAYAAGSYIRPILTPGASVINLGLTSSAYWVHFKFRAVAHDDDWVLDLEYPTLDYIDAYVIDGDKLLATYISGDMRSFISRSVHHRNHLIPLKAAAGRIVDVYVRVHSEGAMTLPFRAWTKDSLASSDNNTYSFLMLCFGMLLALCIYNVVLWFKLRDRSLLSFIAAIFSLGVGLAAHAGLAAEFIWPDTPIFANSAYPVWLAAGVLFGASFARNFLNLGTNKPLFDRALLGCQLLSVLAIISALFFSYLLSAIILGTAALMFATLSFYVGIVAFNEKHPGGLQFMIGWSVMFAAIVITVARTAGWLPSNVVTSNMLLISSVLEMHLMSFAVVDRVNGFNRAREDAVRRMLEVLKQNEKDLERRVDDRTADLQEMNQRLRKSEVELHRLAFHDSLTGLPNRWMIRDRISGRVTSASRSDERFAVLLIDLDRFKPVNDTYGHSVGDAVLVEVANRLRMVIAESGVAGRLGGDEFVVLVEELDDIQNAQHYARAIASMISEPMSINGNIITVDASVGVAMFPRDGRITDVLLSKSDRAMYRIKQAKSDEFMRDRIIRPQESNVA